ncbi:MAG: metal-dependent hydrolase [Tatlockia sp.]|nr:metal-dependent hydrolase [Tatlockia sp.]
MDPITHGALGAATAQLLLMKRDKKNAWLVGALAAMAPDLDVFIRSQQDPMLILLYHRHFTHSLSFIPVGAFLVTLVLILFKPFRKQWYYTFLAALIGYSTHGLLDACTSYGTLLFWPFNHERVSLDLIAIIDPFFTVPIILGLVWTLVNDNRIGVSIGLGLAGIFLLFNSFQHNRALAITESYSKENRIPISRARSFPFLLSSTHWRSVVETNNGFFIADLYLPLMNKSEVTKVGKYPVFKKEDLPEFVKISPGQLRDYKIFDWFSEGFVIIAARQPLILVDGRYLVGENPAIALWGIQFVPGQPHVKSVSGVKVFSKDHFN